MSLVSSLMRASRLGAAAVLCGSLFAGALAPHAARAADRDLLSFGVGAYDVVQNEDSTAAFQLEYLSGKKLWLFNPFAGVMGTLDSAVYGYAGIAYDLKLSDHWVVTPSIAVGLYARGDGRDLGSPVEFRSALAVNYQFDNGVRAGLQFYHLSNAGLTEQNPGTEVLLATYAIPLGK
ncbi:MAG: acyloxyacyl hydrolase [Alphaproteobacteria bacterium]